VSKGGERDFDTYPSPRLTFSKIKRELRIRGRGTNNNTRFNDNGVSKRFSNREAPDLIDYDRNVIYEGLSR
jgi:hypothetical protein